MQNNTILVTDSLFIGEANVRQLEDAGYTVRRIDKPNASENELIEGLAGAVGYILGGVERVTSKVICSATELRAIAFTGSGYTEFIPDHADATARGIAISAAIGGNAPDVAEFAFALMLQMVRNLPLVQTACDDGGKSFYVARRLGGLTLGVIGMGHVGSEVARLGMMTGMRVLAASRSAPTVSVPGVLLVTLKELLESSDIVSVHVSKEHGCGVVGESSFKLMKAGAILVNVAFPEAVDNVALLSNLKSGHIRAAFDAPPPVLPTGCAPGVFITSNAQTAFNTREGNAAISDRVTLSMLNLLRNGDDADLVNPQYRQFREGRW